MTQLPPEQRRGSDPRPASDWDAILSGDAPRGPERPPRPAPQGPAPQGPAPQGPPPRSRRELRDAEQRRAGAEREGERHPSASERDRRDPREAPSSYPAPHARGEGTGPIRDGGSRGRTGRPPEDEAWPPRYPDRRDERPARGPRPAEDADRREPDLLNPWDDDPAPRSSRPARRSAADLDLDEHEVEQRRRGRGAIGCLVALLVLAGLAAAAFFFLQGPINAVLDRFQPPEDYTGAGTGEVVFMINEGDGGEAIAANLESQDIVASAEAFIDEMRSRPESPTFYPGAYGLANQMSSEAALDALLDPASKMENTFVVQEGLWARDALAAASAATGIPVEELQAAAADPQALGLPAEATSIEGFLFPATYTFGPDVTADEVIRTMVDRTFQSLDAAGVAPEDRWETIIIASLIERESGSEADSYKVSRVIRNRLDPALFDSGLLQFDSTVHYGTGDDTVVTTTDAERADASNPYNTYVHPGLTPGPIGNPGDVAIDAARNPADGPWLYFVTVNLETGETVFSATFAEHEQAVQRFYQYLEENG
ncbi:endolytic transglycosylase MltG [Agromyces arachidis]|uniref:endolytic transglycosylase MltG n=1 Tax=Agromyces arachidis TaxID=766966 RepID=UPI004057162A